MSDTPAKIKDLSAKVKAGGAAGLLATAASAGLYFQEAMTVRELTNSKAELDAKFIQAVENCQEHSRTLNSLIVACYKDKVLPDED